MPETIPAARLVRFATFEADLRTGELRRAGLTIKLSRQPFQVLAILLEQPGEVVTREELQRRLWPDTFVEVEHNLNAAINKIREVLGDSAENPRFVETLSRRGYRFIAPVTGVALPRATPVAAPPALPQSQAHSPTRGKLSSPLSALLGLVLVSLLVAAALLYQRSRASHSPLPPQRALNRITFDDGLQTDPTWSPDGRYLAYSSDRGGTTQIWVQQISGGDPIQITHGPGPNWEPDWSPDGRYIAYRSDGEWKGISVLPALGGAGQERRIAPFGYNPRWSPDSTSLLFQSGPLEQKGISTFSVAGLDGEPAHRVLDSFLQSHRNLDPLSAAWHPDGRRVTIWVDDALRPGPVPSFWTVPLDGGSAVFSEAAPEVEQEFTKLGAPSGNEWGIDYRFTWAPAGDAIYLERTFRGARSLWRLRMEPKTLREAGLDRLTTGAGLDTSPALSPDGKKLAFTAATGKVSPWLYPLDANRGRLTGAGAPVTATGMDAWFPAVTRDGGKLVFEGVRGGEGRLLVKSLPDGPEIPLFVDSYLRGIAQWSPDGTHLAYERSRDNQMESQIMMWSAKTRQEQPVTTPERLESSQLRELVYDWSGDGSSLLVTKGTLTKSAAVRGQEPIGDFVDVDAWQIPIAAAPHAEVQARKIISDPRYQIYQQHLSPDGHWIVFEAVGRDPAGPVDNRLSSLFVMRSSGGPWIPIIDDQFWADKPRWSPDGKLIYFLWAKGSFFNIWAIRFNPETGQPAGDPFPVTKLDSPSLMFSGHLAIAEVGVSAKSLVLTLGQLKGGIWIMDNVDR